MTGGPSSEGTILHAGCVALDGRGLLILGPSGSGKSALALALLARGARLVADDQSLLHRRGDRLVASSPPALSGLIEARGVGILRAPPLAEAEIALAVDLGQAEPDRLPPRRTYTCLGLPVDLVFGAGNAHLTDALLQFLRGGRHA